MVFSGLTICYIKCSFLIHSNHHNQSLKVARRCTDVFNVQHLEKALIPTFSCFTSSADESFSAAGFCLGDSRRQQKTDHLGASDQTEEQNDAAGPGSLCEILPLPHLCIKHRQLVSVAVDVHVRKPHACRCVAFQIPVLTRFILQSWVKASEIWNQWCAVRLGLSPAWMHFGWEEGPHLADYPLHGSNSFPETMAIFFYRLWRLKKGVNMSW